VLTFKVLHGIASEYIGPVVCVSYLSGRQSLRSAGTNHLCYFSCDFSVTVSVKVVHIQIFQLQLQFFLTVNRFFSMSFSYKIFQFQLSEIKLVK